MSETVNRVCLNCGRKYAVQPGQITGGLCPKCTESKGDKQ